MTLIKYERIYMNLNGFKSKLTEFKPICADFKRNSANLCELKRIYNEIKRSHANLNEI